MPASMMRSAAAVLTPIAAAAAIGVAAAPAGAAPLSTSEPQVCQYSYDQAWRVVPVTLSGTLTDGSGGELVPGAPLASGDRVRLTNATVTATLPAWIGPFAFDGGIIGNGVTAVPIHGWVALEATNTLEGTTAPIRIDTTATAHANVPVGQAPTEDNAYFDPVTASIPEQAWTASGGDVLVRQAVGTKMAPIPAGRDGSPVRVNGSLFVAAELDASTRLFLDCLTGDQLAAGGGHSDRLPTPLTGLGFRVPGFTGAVDGAALAEPVDAQLENPGLVRGAAGQAVTVDGTTLRLRLSDDQRETWLGTTGTASVSGDVAIVGDRSTAGQQTVALPAASVAAAGSDEIVLGVPATTWTPTGSSGVDLRSADTITLRAVVGGETRTLTLTRDLRRPTAYPFAYVLGPDPRTRFEGETPGGGGGVGTTNPPPLGPVKGFAPPPVRAPKRTTVKIRSTVLKRKKGKLRVRLTNLDKKVTVKGRFTLVTRSKYRLGKSKKRKRFSVVASRSFSLKKGKSRTYTVKLTKNATRLLKTRKSLKAKLTVTPSSTKTQKTVTRTVTVKR